MVESYFDTHHEGFDTDPSEGAPFDEPNRLANDQVTAYLVKTAFKNPAAFPSFLRWLFKPTQISDEMVEKTQDLIQRKGNIFRRKQP